MLTRVTRRLAFALAWSVGPSLAGTAPDLGDIAQRLDESTLDFAAAVALAPREIPLTHGSLGLESGVLIPVRVPREEGVRELVFLGSARFRLEAPDSVEAQQLQYFTGGPRLDVPVREAVLVRADKSFASLLEGRTPAPVAPNDRERARLLFERWTGSTQREGFGARTALIKAIAGDPLGSAFVGFWLHSPTLGPLYYRLDPAADEPVAAGRFRLIEEQDWQTAAYRKRKQRFERWKDRRDRKLGLGRYAAGAGAKIERDCGVDVGEEEAGGDEDEDESWPWVDTWLSARGADAAPDAEPPGFEPSRYTIDVTLSGADLDAKATASIRLEANAAGLRVVPLLLHPALEVCEVLDGEDRPLGFLQEDWSVLVALPEPMPEHVPHEITVRFAGRPIEHLLARRTLRSSLRWHPHVGHRDLATYDVTLRWPAELQLLASGSSLASGQDDGMAWTRQSLEVPTMGFSFEIDELDRVEDHVAHFQLVFGFQKNDAELTAERRAEIVTTAKAALLFFESQLGVLPIDGMTIVTRRRGFSQGLLGFVTLAEGAMHARANPLYENRTEQQVRMETIAHEISHQWWGHVVGWDSYRDQWLSEALASFSAANMLAKLAQDPADHWQRHARAWRTALQSDTFGGQPIAAVGGVTLGVRLLHSHDSEAYTRIVYDKGSAVFSTLTQRLGPEPTWQMLGSLTRAVGGRTIATGTFFRALEHMSGQDLSGFVEQYVKGTGVPGVFYDQRVVDDPAGGYKVEGRIRQLAGESFRFVVERVGEGWDVVRHGSETDDMSARLNVIPYYLETEAAPGAPRAVLGSLTIRGSSSTFSIPAATRPVAFRLDPYGMVLARFHGEADDPKRYLYELGRHFARSGRAQEAEQALAGALTAKTPDASSDLDAAIRLARARVFLDQGDAGRAKTELREAERALPDGSKAHAGDRAILRARLELRAGAAEVALATLREFLAEHSIAMDMVAADVALEGARFSGLRVARGELLALLAAIEVSLGGRNARPIVRLAELAGADVRALGVR